MGSLGGAGGGRSILRVTLLLGELYSPNGEG
jgi:hypothetical protein